MIVTENLRVIPHPLVGKKLIKFINKQKNKNKTNSNINNNFSPFYPKFNKDDEIFYNNSCLLPSSSSGASCMCINFDFMSRCSLDTCMNICNAILYSHKPLFQCNYVKCFVPFNQIQFSKGALSVLNTINAGGSSELSETLSFEMLRREFGCQLLKTEMAINYNYQRSKRTDYSISLYSRCIGVSVTRAMKYNGQQLFSSADAQVLLRKKLHGVNISTENVTEEDKWDKQILHVFTTHAYIIDILHDAFRQIQREEEQLVANTIVIVSLVKGGNFVFTNKS